MINDFATARIEGLNAQIQNIDPQYRGDISDGWHTFDELYETRSALTAALFNTMPKTQEPHKSKRHHDGELCFGGDWFIVCAKLPSGQISFHYPMEFWEDFKIQETEKAIFRFDGHTTKDVINRLLSC